MVAVAGVLLEDLEYDYVVLGTGLTESVLAAALSFAGSRVLHLDANDFYGAQSATLSLSTLKSLLSNNADSPPSNPPADAASLPLPEGAEMHEIPPKPFRKAVFPLGTQLLPPSESADPLSPDVDPRIQIDLSPQLLMGAGPMVELLAQTRVGHYLDFRALEATFLAFPSDGLRRVPASRSDIFRDRFLSMPEKRLLMRYLKSAGPLQGAPVSETEPVTPQAPAKAAPASADEGASFGSAMQAAGLTDKLQALLSYAVVMSPDAPGDMRAADAVDAIGLYQRSLMRFRIATPLLYANYGSGELAQAFCRLCAVRGGVYVLRRRASALVSEAAAKGGGGRSLAQVVTDHGEHVRCKGVFGGRATLPSALGALRPASASGGVRWRAACVVDGSLVHGDAKRALIIVPRGARGNASATVHVRQLDASVKVCPAGMFVVYAETFGGEGTGDDLRAVLESYVAMGAMENDGEVEAEKDKEEGESCEAVRKPNLLWGMIYARPVTEGAAGEVDAGVEGVHVLGEGGAETDSCFAVDEARRWFERVLPGTGFFEEPEDGKDEKVLKTKAGEMEALEDEDVAKKHEEEVSRPGNERGDE